MGIQLNSTILFFQHYPLALFQYLKSLASCPKSSMHSFCVVQLMKDFSEIGSCARSSLRFFFFFFDVTAAHVLRFCCFFLVLVAHDGDFLAFRLLQYVQFN